MQKKQKIFCLFFLIVLNATVAIGQSKKILFDKIGVPEGLPIGEITDIMQDSDGYIWIGSYEGFFKHDGEKLIPSDQGTLRTTLTTPRTYDIEEDADHNIWIGTYTGLCKLDKKTGEITQYVNVGDKKVIPGNKVYHVFSDKENNIWINTDKGIALYNRKLDHFHSIPKLSGVHVHSFFESDDGILLGTTKGLYSLDKEKFKYVSFLPSKEQQSIKNVYNIYKDNKGIIWLCTKNGLWQYHPASKQVSKATIFSGELANLSVKRMVQDILGTYWIAMDNQLITFDLNSKEIKIYNESNLKNHSNISGQVRELFADKNGNIWLGTDSELQKINPKAQGFDFYQLFPNLDENNAKNDIQRIHELPNGGLLYFSRYYLYYVRKLGDTPMLVKNAPANFTAQLYTMPNGEVWIPYTAPAFGIWRFNPGTISLERLKISEEVDNQVIYQIGADIDLPEICLIGAKKGFYKYNLITKQVERVNFKTSISRPYPLIRRFVQSKSGKIWMDAGMVLLSYDKKNGKITEYTKDINNKPHKHYRVREILEGPKGKIWLGHESGLASYDDKKGLFETFTTANGLKGGNIIYAMVFDNQGKLWFSTYNQIISFEPATKLFNYYSKPEGIHTTFNRISATKLSDGRLAFAGVNGMVVFHPDSLEQSDNTPPVVISSINVNNKPYDSKLTPEHQESVILSYADKVISFEFKALEYVDKERNEFAYMMLGFDKNWIYNNSKNVATYTNLDPGKYTFQVKTTNFSGVWSDKSISKVVYVKPLFWQQLWFRALIIITILAFLYYLWNNNRAKHKYRQQKEVAEQNNTYKSLFLSNVSHEIRTPLNAIIGLNKLLLDTKLDPKQHKYVYAVGQSSDTLLTLINDLLNQSKIESGRFTFNNRPFSINKVVHQVQETYIHKAEEKNLALKIYIDKNIPQSVSGDPVRLHQILSNLVSNAIKFTNMGSVEVKISLTRSIENTATIFFQIKDTGIGINSNELEKIFESFHQVENIKTPYFNIGTGLGLTISKNLIEQQGGTIKVSSKKELGTIFSFELNFQQVDKIASIIENKKPLPSQLKKIKILLVEDTLFNQLLAIEILKKNIEEVNVSVAENGKEALTILLKNTDFDIVLMDVKMPIMNGYETTIAIRKLNGHYYKQLPILALTANAIPEQLENCKSSGMNDWITKPIDETELIQKITNNLNKS